MLHWIKAKVTFRRVAAALFGLMIAAELIARYGLGFGQPPVVLLDDQIEYYLKPSSEYRRFGNRIAVNSHGMRGPEFVAKKASADEFRLLVLGDSIVYGGNKLDQEELATSLLAEGLGAALGRPVTVANIACSSWGPPNVDAFLARFGTFDGDAAVIVLSSHDIADVPIFNPLTEPYWTEAPWCALHDLGEAVYERIFKRRQSLNRELRRGLDPEQARRDVLAALGRVVDRLDGAGMDVYVALHLERAEAVGVPHGGYGEFGRFATSRDLKVIDLGPRFKSTMDKGDEPYDDYIHPNALGMRLMAEAIQAAVLGGRGE